MKRSGAAGGAVTLHPTSTDLPTDYNTSGRARWACSRCGARTYQRDFRPPRRAVGAERISGRGPETPSRDLRVDARA